MSPVLAGSILGLVLALGLLLVASRVRVIRRTQPGLRVMPYVRDLPEVGKVRATRVTTTSPVSVVGQVFGPVLISVATTIDRVLGGSRTIRRNLVRAGLLLTVQEFRIQQVMWGLVGFAAAAAFGLLRTFFGAPAPTLYLLLCLVGFLGGVIARDQYLGSQVLERERKIVAEFPTIAELLALAVNAGESPVAALERVVSRSGGALSEDLAEVLAQIRTGASVADAFDGLAARTGLPAVARFAQGIAVAVERGTPLADVLHAEAGDVREAGRRALIEVAAKKEVSMMVPVVFLILPVTLVFAFYPGLIGLSLTVP